MKQKIFGYIAREINRLTNDEDLRQDLWLFFLEGNSPFSFKDHLGTISDKDVDSFVNMELSDGSQERF
jgi:hypothetical protein